LIKLRLQRKGRKKRPFYHIVVADSRSPRDGRIIERLGRFDNVSERKELTYDEERIIHWLKIGAQPSDTVRSILKGEGILYKMHLMRWGKSDEEIEAALEQLQPELEAFMEKVKESGIPSPRTIADEAFSLRQMLPTPRDENHKSFLQDSILKAFDKELLKFSPQEKVLETAQKLFERLLEQMEHFSLYA
jgi:small subunit ribosomal protein S16